MPQSKVPLIIFITIFSFITSCGELPNSPYPTEDLPRNFFYRSFDTPPKTLDPAISYSSDEYAIIGAIYENPLQYHLLKRPYILQPMLLRDVPQPEYRKKITVTTLVSKQNNKFFADIQEEKLLANIQPETIEIWEFNGWEPGIIAIENVRVFAETTLEFSVSQIVSKIEQDKLVYYVIAEHPEGFDVTNINPETEKFAGMTQAGEYITLNIVQDEELISTFEFETDKQLLFAVSDPKVLVKAETDTDSIENDSQNEEPQTREGFQLKSDKFSLISVSRAQSRILSIGEEMTEIQLPDSFVVNTSNILVRFDVWLSSNEKEAFEVFSGSFDSTFDANFEFFKIEHSVQTTYPNSQLTGDVRSYYTMRVMPGIYYQPHPCFSRDEETGEHLFHTGKEQFFRVRKTAQGEDRHFLMQNGREIEITKQERKALSGKPIDQRFLSSVFDMKDFQSVFTNYNPEISTREVTAADFVYQLKRWWNPRRVSPIAGNMLKYFIEPMTYYHRLRETLETIRKQRRAEKGIAYSQEVDERENPITLDFEIEPFNVAKVVDRYTYQIVLNQPYPQLKYWFAMPFFCPFPWEADVFFNQGAMHENDLTINRFPVGTGAYRMDLYDRQMEIRTVVNENFNRKGPEDGKKPPIFKKINRIQNNNSEANKILSTDPEFVLKGEKAIGIGVDKNNNGKLDGSYNLRDYLVPNNFAETPFYDDNNNGIYDGLRYWDEREMNARIDWEYGYIDYNHTGTFDEGDRRFNPAEGIYFEDLNMNGIFEPELGEKWFTVPATARAIYPEAGSINSAPDEILTELNKLQQTASKLYVDFEKNKDEIYRLDAQIADEIFRLMDEHGLTEDDLGDYATSLLRDAGRRLPFIDAIIQKREKEATSYWTKFTQGYYELSGIGEERFDSIVNISPGGAFLSDDLRKLGINLRTTPRTSVWYLAFNMTQNIWGWAEDFDADEPNEDWRKIRQAISIVLDNEEFNDLFSNSRNMAGHGPIPPGIFGYEPVEEKTFIDLVEDLEWTFSEKINLKDGASDPATINDMTEEEKIKWTNKYSVFFTKFKNLNKYNQRLARQQKFERSRDEYSRRGLTYADIEFEPDDILAEVHYGLNWVVYTWDRSQGAARRRPVEHARALMTEAGFPGGKNPAGTQLELRFLTMGTSAAMQDIFAWRTSKLRQIGIEFRVEARQYNQFRELVDNGNFHSLEWGWNADYPDPENFMFLFEGKNHKAPLQNEKKFGKGGGENAANYWNEEFDELFSQMATMSDSPERLRIIRKMVNIVRRDVPWVFNNFGMSYVLFHHWYKNSKSNLMGHNAVWYRRINPDQRYAYRLEHNQPRWTPVIIFFVVAFVLIFPGMVLRYIRENKKQAARSKL